MSYGPVQVLDMKSGDVLVLLTDGFFEWPNPDGEMFGTERLGQAIKEAHGLPAQAIIKHLQGNSFVLCPRHAPRPTT